MRELLGALAADRWHELVSMRNGWSLGVRLAASVRQTRQNTVSISPSIL
ncbi:hypothetical protein RRSWK_03639 [Rhodopirellula sp. SWK7]|nr:hypothetical protein RRSWK_03639 [Rhodopirellula sp. SWK7]